jgi:hypothetical protein
VTVPPWRAARSGCGARTRAAGRQGREVPPRGRDNATAGRDCITGRNARANGGAAAGSAPGSAPACSIDARARTRGGLSRESGAIQAIIWQPSSSSHGRRLEGQALLCLRGIGRYRDMRYMPPAARVRAAPGVQFHTYAARGSSHASATACVHIYSRARTVTMRAHNIARPADRRLENVYSSSPRRRQTAPCT